MDWINIISTTAVGVIVGLVIAYLNQAVYSEVNARPDGKIELKMNVIYKWLGWGSLVIFIIMVIAVAIFEDAEWWLMLVALIIFGIPGTMCLLYAVNHFVVFDDEKIIANSWTNKQVEMIWSDIVHVKFKRISGYLQFKDKADQKINIHMHIVGLSALVQKLEERTNFNAGSLRLPM